MYLESLTIGLKQPYGKPGKDNPYQAKLSVSYDETKMQVKLSDETCLRILALAKDEIAAAAQVQISDFVAAAFAVNTMPLIEAAPVPEYKVPF